MARIHTVLEDDFLLNELQEAVEAGASIEVAGAVVGLPPGTLTKWLTLGKTKPRTPYRTLYNKYRKWAASATIAAQGQLLAKNPAKWLEVNTSAKVVEPEAPKTQLSLPGVQSGVPQQNTVNVLNISTEDLQKGFAAMMESGLTLTQALNKPITLEQANGNDPTSKTTTTDSKEV
jgi:hypothetical protein